MPPSARWLGAAGLLPFLLTAAMAWVGPADWRDLALFALATYGMVILSFLGGVHWGLALNAPAAEAPYAAPRFALGVVPSLIGWAALMLPPVPGLAMVALAILATAVAESLAARRGLVPPAYLRLRWALSLGAALCLLAGAVAAAGA